MADSLSKNDIKAIENAIAKSVKGIPGKGNITYNQNFRQEILKRQEELLSQYSEKEESELLDKLYNSIETLRRNLQNAVDPKLQANLSDTLEKLEKRAVSQEVLLSDIKKAAENSAEVKSKQDDNKLKAVFKGLGSDIKDDFGNIKNDLLKSLPSGISEAVGSGSVGVGIALAVKAVNALTDVMAKGMQEALALQDQYLGQIDTRLNGVQNFLRDDQTSYYNQIFSDLGDFSNNQYVSMKSVLDNIAKLSNNGIAYNIEERAILETISDRLATTFSAVDGGLTRLIRIQQADLTRSQLGSEIRLNEFLNSMFTDTSYLSDVYDSVSESLIDMVSTVSYKEAPELMYTVQKWMGSLYSLGLSSTAVNSIAQSLTSLSTGGIDVLSSPQGKLLGLSAANSGLDISSMLVEGLNTSNINDLMKSMVEYLQQIATNSSASGNVGTRRILEQYGAGLTFADLRAVANVTPEEIARIYAEHQTYDSSRDILDANLHLIGQRTGTNQKINNLLDNLSLTLGQSLISGSDGGMKNLLAYKLANMLPGTLGDIATTAWGIGNFFTDLFSGDKSMLGLAWDAITGTYDLLTGNEFDPSLTYLNSSDVTTRGSFLPVSDIISGEATSGTSASTYRSVSTGRGGRSFSERYRASGGGTLGSSALEAEAASLFAQENATTLSASNTTGANAMMIRDVGDIYAELFENQQHPIRVALAKVEEEASGQLKSGLDRLAVDVVDDDINTLINQVYSIRSRY